MPNILTRILLFLSSYFPLSVIFFVFYLEKNWVLGAIILGFGVLGFLGLLLYLRVVGKIAPIQIKIAGLQRRDGEAMSYIVSYVIPFLAIPFSEWQQSLALSIFLIVLGILYINSNMIHINPTLNLLGYHLYELTLDEGSVMTIITRRRLTRGETVRVINLSDDIILEKKP